MIINTVKVNNRKKCFEILTAKGLYSLPFSRLRLVPRADNKLVKSYVDKELASRAVTYSLESGEEDSVHLDAFLDYNKDPKYMSKMYLYKLTLMTIEAVEKSRLSKREIARKLKTSPAQLYRLLDTANYRKTLDQMIKLLVSLDHQIEFIPKPYLRTTEDVRDMTKEKSYYLNDNEIKETEYKDRFLLPERERASMWHLTIQNLSQGIEVRQIMSTGTEIKPESHKGAQQNAFLRPWTQMANQIQAPQLIDESSEDRTTVTSSAILPTKSPPIPTSIFV